MQYIKNKTSDFPTKEATVKNKRRKGKKKNIGSKYNSHNLFSAQNTENINSVSKLICGNHPSYRQHRIPPGK